MQIFLETERLVLRRVTADDVDNLVELDGDPEVMHFINGGRPTPREEIASDVLPAFLGYYERFAGYGFWAVEEKATGQFVGWFHFRPAKDARSGEVELGYRLRRSAWGQGYATEGSRALIEKGFAELDVHRVVAFTMVVNVASRRVMEKAGLRYVRTFHQPWPDHIEGEEQGDVEYALTRSEWCNTGLVSGDEYVVDTPIVQAFIDAVWASIGAAASPEAACDAIRPRFAELLADPDWLPQQYCGSAPESGMGGGIGQWLLFRAGDRSLSLFSLVVPSGAQTPVHDHLAWGLVGLYRGSQDEEIYAERDDRLELVERRTLAPGDFYALVPPRDDIHRVRTTSAEASVSIHLLSNDTGCIWRHSYDLESGERAPFRSGYVNVSCDE